MVVYNRYTPQPDGTYKRKSVTDHTNIPHPARPMPPCRREEPPKADTVDRIPQGYTEHPAQRKQRPSPRHKQEKSAASFLKDLLPRDLDAGDLLVVILLLLMSADSSGEEQGNALLTLALYLFM